MFHNNRTDLSDLFVLMYSAYSQPLYKDNNELNVLLI